MRKDNGDREKVKGLRYAAFSLKGVNLDGFINALHRRGVPLYDIKKRGKKLRFTVEYADSKKVFAISEEMCYNNNALKKIRESGVAAPFVFLLSHIGVLLGTAVFIAFSVIADDFVFRREFTGGGAAFESDMAAYLDGSGARLYSRFSSLDYDALERGIYSLGRFSFVSVKRRGNTLFIDTELAEKRADTLTGDAKYLIADCDGVIEEIKVYRGTALVKAGDVVKSGDIVAEGFATVKDMRVEVNLIASAVLNTEGAFTCNLKTDGEDDRAVSLAEEYAGGNISQVKIMKEKSGDGYNYTVTFSRRKIIYAG